MLTIQDNDFSLQAFIQATTKLSGADGEHYLIKIRYFKQTKGAYLAHILSVVRFTKSFVPRLPFVGEKVPTVTDRLKDLSALPNNHYIFNLSIYIPYTFRTNLGAPVHRYYGSAKHYLCTHIDPTTVKLDNEELAAIAGILASNILNPVPKAIDYLYSILEANSSYKQVVLATLKDINDDNYGILIRDVQLAKGKQEHLDSIQQVYKDLLHDTTNYRNTRYKHTSYLQDYIKSKDLKSILQKLP